MNINIFVHFLFITQTVSHSISFNQKKRKSTIRFWYQVLEYLVATICETYYESSHKTSFIIHNIRCSISETRRNFFHSLSLSLAPVVIARCCLYFTGNFKYFAVKSFRHMQSSSACICELADKHWALRANEKNCFEFSINIFQFVFDFIFCIHSQFFFLLFLAGWDSQHNKSLRIKFRAVDWRWWQIDNMPCWKSKSNRTISGNNVEIERCL